MSRSERGTTARLVPRLPEEFGVVVRELSILDVEGARLLANDARPQLCAAGFSDEAIQAWVDAFFAERHEGSVRELLAWIAQQQRGGVSQVR
jgi:hypothetical protein